MAQGNPSLRARVLAAAQATPVVTRKQGRTAAGVLTAASAAIAVVIFEEIGGIRHGTGRPLSITISLAVGWTAISALLTWLVLGRASSTMARRPALIAAAALAMPFVLFGWMQLFYGSYTEPFQRVGYRCLSYTLVISALPLASFLVLRRAIEPRHPTALGAAAGAACAAWAGALIDLWCPLTNPMHVLVGHVAPLGIAMIAGAILGRFTLGARRFQMGRR